MTTLVQLPKSFTRVGHGLGHSDAKYCKWNTSFKGDNLEIGLYSLFNLFALFMNWIDLFVFLSFYLFLFLSFCLGTNVVACKCASFNRSTLAIEQLVRVQAQVGARPSWGINTIGASAKSNVMRVQVMHGHQDPQHKQTKSFLFGITRLLTPHMTYKPYTDPHITLGLILADIV